MTRVVLGSASTGRLGVLRQAGLDPLVVVSGVDEDAVMASLAGSPPETVVSGLAAAKADEVFAHLPAAVASDCVVIGCDSMLLLDGQLCGKPGDVDTARKQWQAMSAGLLSCTRAMRCSSSATGPSPIASPTPVSPQCISALPRTRIWRHISRAVSHSVSRAVSHSTDSVAGSSTASTETRPM